MRRCHASALAIILGIAVRIAVLLCLMVGRQSSIAAIWIAAHRKPYKRLSEKDRKETEWYASLL
jgi:hypothetical protein